MRVYGGQAFIDQPHRDRTQSGREPTGVVPRERAASPSSPESSRGSPTTTSIASSSSTRAAIAARSLSPSTSRGSVRTGWAKHARGVRRGDADAGVAHVDADACPGTGSHGVGQASGAPVAQLVLDGAERRGDLRRVGAAALGEVVLAATTAAERLGRDLDEGTGLRPASRARSFVATMTTGRPPRRTPSTRAPGGRCRAGRARRVTSARRSSADDAVAGVVADEGDAADVARDSARGRPPHRAPGPADRRDLLLGLAQPAEDAGDPVGQLVAARLRATSVSWLTIAASRARWE